MDVSPAGSMPVDPSAEGRAVAREMIALKKQQDAAKAHAEGMLTLIQNAAPTGDVGRRLNVYA